LPQPKNGRGTSAPALASASLGREMYEQWVKRGNELVTTILAGGDYRKLPRFGDVYSDDPADAAAANVNQRLELQHKAWLRKLSEKSLE
jgi:hypothetical protein